MKNKIVEQLLERIIIHLDAECEGNCEECPLFTKPEDFCWQVKTIKGYIEGLENLL